MGHMHTSLLNTPVEHSSILNAHVYPAHNTDKNVRDQ